MQNELITDYKVDSCMLSYLHTDKSTDKLVQRCIFKPIPSTWSKIASLN